MAFLQKDMKNILQKYAGFGYLIAYLLDQEKLTLEPIEQLFLKMNPDIADLFLKKMLKQVTSKEMEAAFVKASSCYSKKTCLEEYFVYSETKLMLKNDVYDTILNYRSTEKILKEILKNKTLRKDQQILKQYQILLKELIKETKESVVKSKITVKAG